MNSIIKRLDALSARLETLEAGYPRGGKVAAVGSGATTNPGTRVLASLVRNLNLASAALRTGKDLDGHSIGAPDVASGLSQMVATFGAGNARGYVSLAVSLDGENAYGDCIDELKRIVDAMQGSS